MSARRPGPSIDRRQALGGLAAGAGLALGAADARPQGPAAGAGRIGQRILRYAFPAAETGFDPAQVSDLYSRIVTAHIFDGLYEYDYLHRPYRIRPLLAEAMPETSADARRFVVRLRRGIHFADDPVFGGRRRELVAQDFVYSFKRFVDPATKSPLAGTVADLGLVGLNELRDQVLKSRTPFPYDLEVEGLRTLDRYTLQLTTREPRPRIVHTLATGDVFGAVAREVVQAYGERIMEHPVGTGPFRLAEWRRSSRIVLERNPGYRERVFDAEPAPGDPEGLAIAERLRGRRLPMLDRVEISVINESQPRWLAFLDRQFDLISVPPEFSPMAVPNGQLAPNLARQGIRRQRTVMPQRTLVYFNMEDPVVGGYTPPKVALRRAIGLASDLQREIDLIRRGQAIPAQSMIAPGTWGYDPRLKTSNSDFDLARANALLDLYGYDRRDAQGWRRQPDGSPLVIDYPSQPDPQARQFDENWKRSFDAIGVRMQVRVAQWPEQLKAARAGELMLWQLGYTAANPDAQDALNLLYGPASGGQNLARFRHAPFDAIYRRMAAMPDGPERLALLREAQKIVLAYLPHRYNVHPITNDLLQPRLAGYRRPLFTPHWWTFVDVAPQGA